jgi:hypothetical protein
MEYRQDIALLSARLGELLESGESQVLWENAGQSFANLRSAMQRGDRPAIAAHLRETEEYLTRGLADSLRWQEVYQVIDQLTRTKEREYRRLITMQQMVSTEQLIAILGQIAHAAKQTITNPADFRAFTKIIAVYSTANLSLTD